MPGNIMKIAHHLGAICYTLWGSLHILAALGISQLGASQDVGMVQGKLYQSAWNLMYIAIFAIVIAVYFNWRNSWLGYWLNLSTISVTDIGFLVLLYIPGYSNEIIGPILWILGAIFSTIGILKSPRTI